jgi:hypothetical protein
LTGKPVRALDSLEEDGLRGCPHVIRNVFVRKESVPDMHSLLLQVLTNKNVPDHMRASAQAILF